MKRNRLLDAFVVLAFILAIGLPLVFADFEGGQVSAAENRYLASFPDLIEGGRLVFSPSAFDSWINDNVGGRQLAQEVEGRLSYKLDHLHKGNVIEGKEQWLYLLPDYDVPEYANTDLPTEEGLDLLCEAYERIADTLAERGIGFVLAMYPRKYHVYPEYMPDTIAKVGAVSAYTLISERLHQSATLHFADPCQQLLEAKQDRLTYSKAHDASHWNNYGAFIGYKSLMEQVQRVLPDIRILTEADFLISEAEISTVKENGFSTRETDLVYELKENQASADKAYLAQLGFRGTDQWQSYNYYRNENTDLPKAVIVGDSFTWMFQLDWLAQSFGELAFIHYNDLSELDVLISQLSPDVVIGAFLSSGVWSTYSWESVAENTLPGLLPVVDYAEWGYQFVDYLGSTLSGGNVLTVNSGDVTSFIEGWAVDPLAGTTASAVVLQIGDQYYYADYGKERDSVSDYFQNDAYLQSGYTATLDTQELMAAGQLMVHVLSADGTYQYPPSVYTIQSQ